jgi:serine/threonine protein kinase
MSKSAPAASSRAARIIFSAGTTISDYTVVSLLGQGGFGDVYKVSDRSSSFFALKTEFKDAHKQGLLLEVECLLQCNSPSFPRVHAHGETDLVRYYVMDIFGCSLSDVRKSHFNSFPSKTAIFIAIEMLRVIERLHSQGFIHCDIKLSNFMLNRSTEFPLVLIDFGLGCRYTDPQTGEHLPQEDGRFRGTKRYASLNALQRLGLGRRDDVISWFYALIEMYKEKLPWASLKTAEDVTAAKEAISIQTLCSTSLRPAPQQLLSIWTKISALQYEDMPPYQAIINLLINWLSTSDFAGPADFAWDEFYHTEMKIEDADMHLPSDPAPHQDESPAREKEDEPAKKRKKKAKEDQQDEGDETPECQCAVA